MKTSEANMLCLFIMPDSLSCAFVPAQGIIFSKVGHKKTPHFFIIVTVVFLIGCRLENLARSYIDAYTQTPTHAHLTTSDLWAKMLHRVNLIFTISRAQSVEYNTTLTQCNAMRKFFCPCLDPSVECVHVVHTCTHVCTMHVYVKHAYKFLMFQRWLQF